MVKWKEIEERMIYSKEKKSKKSRKKKRRPQYLCVFWKMSANLMHRQKLDPFEDNHNIRFKKNPNKDVFNKWKTQIICIFLIESMFLIDSTHRKRHEKCVLKFHSKWYRFTNIRIVLPLTWSLRWRVPFFVYKSGNEWSPRKKNQTKSIYPFKSISNVDIELITNFEWEKSSPWYTSSLSIYICFPMVLNKYPLLFVFSFYRGHHAPFKPLHDAST